MSASQPPTPVADYLASLAEEKKSGLLEIHRGPYRGQLFLQNGALVQAEFLGKTGVSAAYDLLALDEAMLHWHPSVNPVSVSLNLNVAELLAELRAAAEAAALPEAEEPEPAAADLLPFSPGGEISAPLLSSGQNTESELLRQVYIVLEWLNAPQQVDPFLFKHTRQASYLIGQAKECDLILGHAGVEPVHASLLVQADYVELWDLGTDRKTAVNGEITEQAVLSPGDVITLGGAELRFTLRLRRLGDDRKIPVEEPRAERPSPGPLRGPITAQSLLEQRQAQSGKAFGKALGKFFEKKKDRA